MPISINIERLKQDIECLGQIGCTPEGGVSRPSFSQPDLEARNWLKNKIIEAGLAYREDGAGNQFGHLGGKGPVVMTGSHIDTVINGGKYDGPVGVLSALECLRRIKEEGIPLSKAVEVVAFTDEEGSLVGDFLGSRAFSGQLNEELLRSAKTSYGLTLEEVLKNTPYSIESITSAWRERPDVEAFLELHIEQGPILDLEETPIGLVTDICGKRYYLCSYKGEAAHSATTPFEMRRDAFLGLADFVLSATHHAASKHYGNLLTVGKASLHPGVFSVIAGRADFTLDLRGLNRDSLEILEKEVLDLANDIAGKRGLNFFSRLMDRTVPVKTPEKMMAILEEECLKLGYKFMNLISGAGHDAQIISAITQSGMIFIPCVDGLSHSAEERIRWDDLEKGANLLLAAIVRLAS